MLTQYSARPHTFTWTLVYKFPWHNATKYDSNNEITGLDHVNVILDAPHEQRCWMAAIMSRVLQRALTTVRRTVCYGTGYLLSYLNYTHLQQNFSQHNPGRTESGVQAADIHMPHNATAQTCAVNTWPTTNVESKPEISLSPSCHDWIPIYSYCQTTTLPHHLRYFPSHHFYKFFLLILIQLSFLLRC